jgi:RNA polymerase sigma-70 factor (ECF subfamily)
MAPFQSLETTEGITGFHSAQCLENQSGFLWIGDMLASPHRPPVIPEPSPFDEQSTLSSLEFDALLADAQPRLRGYLASILGAWSDVDDLVQETNLVLVLKRHTFESGTNFIAWAFRVAYFKATTWRRDRMREGRVVLGEVAFQDVAAQAEAHFSDRPPVVDALAKCLQLLPPRERELISAKYVDRRSLVDLAAARGCSANSLHKAISRIRLALRKCISQTLQHKHP